MTAHGSMKTAFDVEKDEEHRDHVEADGETAARVAYRVHAALVGASLGPGVLVLADQKGAGDHAPGGAERDQNLQSQREVVPGRKGRFAWASLSLGGRLSSVKERRSRVCAGVEIQSSDVYQVRMAVPKRAPHRPPAARKEPKGRRVAAPARPRARRARAKRAAVRTPKKRARTAGSEAEKGRDHGEELHVAEAHALAVTERLVDPADGEQEQRSGDDGQEAAEDEVLGAGKKDVALVAAGTGAVDVDAAVKQKLLFAGTEEDGMGADEKKAEEHSGKRESVGKEMVLPVDDEQREEEEAEQGGGKGREDKDDEMVGGDGGRKQAGGRAKGDETEVAGCGELDGGVAPGDPGGTVAAAGTEQKEREQGEVVVPGDRVPADRAVGARCRDALSGRQAGDEDIEEAAEKKTQHKRWGG